MVPLSSPTFLLMSTWKIHPCCNEPFRWVQGWIRRGSSAQWQLYLVTRAPFSTLFRKHVYYLVWTFCERFESNLMDSTSITSRGVGSCYIWQDSHDVISRSNIDSWCNLPWPSLHPNMSVACSVHYLWCKTSQVFDGSFIPSLCFVVVCNHAWIVDVLFCNGGMHFIR